MNAIFADTSFFIALLDADDFHHQQARQFLASNHAPLLSSSAIVLELGGFYADAPLRAGFVHSLAAISSAGIQIVHVDSSLQQRAIALFRARPDKDWSLADCISFLVMEDREMTQAATSDHHFEQAGFAALLRQPLKK